MKKILVIGKNGQLAWELNRHFDQDIEFTNRDELNLENTEQIKSVLKKVKPNIVINAGAYTQVDLAEKEQQKALSINGEAVNTIAKLAKELGFWFIHISTDFVFDGSNNRPYIESDPISPLGVYGESKAQGEKFILALHEDIQYTIIRTSWVYSQHGHNFVKTMLRLAQEKEELNIVFDQIGTPTHAKDLAGVIKKFVTNGYCDKYKGIFNFSNEGVTSWYDFAVAIKKIKNLKTKYNPIRSEEYPTPAKRPAYSVLDKTKIKRILNIKINHWLYALEEMLHEL
jgi:dTDP-4-dehydrorhamnose reductase